MSHKKAVEEIEQDQKNFATYKNCSTPKDGVPS